MAHNYVFMVMKGLKLVPSIVFYEWVILKQQKWAILIKRYKSILQRASVLHMAVCNLLVQFAVCTASVIMPL